MSSLALLSKLEQAGIKIHLEKGDLKIIAPKGKLSPGLIDELKLQKNEIIHFLEALEVQRDYASINPVEEREYYQLSSAQKRLYIIQQFNLKSSAYNMPYHFSLPSNICKKRIKDTFLKLIQRYEVFRTSFLLVNDEPVQKIHEEVRFEIDEISESLDHIYDGKEINTGISDLLNNFITPFNLSKAPLIRVGLLKLEKLVLILMDMHHIISDGESINLLMRDFGAIQKGEGFVNLRIQYKDFTLWQNSCDYRDFLKKQKDYWVNIFVNESPVLDLPLDFPRPVEQSFEGYSISFELLDSEVESLRNLTLEINGTLFATILSIFAIFLSKLSGHEDIIIGSPIANRRHTDLNDIIGNFINSLAIRTFPSREKSFTEFLIEVKAAAISALENQEYPFEDLVDQLDISRNTGRNPLFDVMFNYINSPKHTPGLLKEINVDKTVNTDHRASVSKFDITLFVVEIEDRISFTIEYCSHLFQPTTIDRFIQYFRNTMATLLKNSKLKLSKLEIITEQEKHQILILFNQTHVEYSTNKRFIELFEEQVARTPDVIALVGNSINNAYDKTGDKKRIYLSYNQLNESSIQLSHLIGFNPGPSGEAIIGLMTERTLEMVIGLLGILKSGSAYLPIGPEYPSERIQYMLEESDVSILLVTNPSLVSIAVNSLLRIIDLREALDITCNNKEKPVILNKISSPSQLLYVIYTSGTTGIPKGVMIENQSIVNFIKGITAVIPFAVNDRLLSLTTLSFDIFGLEVLLPLAIGSRVIIGDENEQLDAGLSAKVLSREQITVLQVTPSRLQLIFSYPGAAEGLRKIEHLIVGGEAFALPLLEKARKVMKGRIYNVYGPTETTIWSTIKELTNDNAVSIGKPLANTHIYIVDPSFFLQPIGIAGDLCISGHGLARGYLKNERLTSETFIPNPFINQSEGIENNKYYKRIYLTGDLGRWLNNGNLEFLGRKDHQVKLRGYRIELDEIEAQLLNIKGIKKAVVFLVEKQQDKHICAYMVLEGTELQMEISHLREEIGKRLPSYMIPSYFMKLEQIPLTANGKVNRKALPTPEITKSNEYIAPENEMEKQLVRIWSEVLGVNRERLSVSANFFAIGGNSLHATIIISKAHQLLGIKLPLAEIFKTPTIRGLSKIGKKYLNKSYTFIQAVEKKDFYKLSSYQKQMYFLQRYVLNSVIYNLPLAILIEGNLDTELFIQSWYRLIDRHDSLRTSFPLIDKNPVQRIFEKVSFTIENIVRDEINHHLSMNPKYLIKLSHFIRPFDLSKAPLIRIGLEKIANEKYLFMLDMHHIISDGVSGAILTREVIHLYQGKNLSKIYLQYKDFAEWQNISLNTSKVLRQKAYWMDQFSGKESMLRIPSDYPESHGEKEKIYQGSNETFTINNELTQKIENLMVEEDVTLFIILLSIYYVFLSKYSEMEDITIGIPTSIRNDLNLEKIVGIFVNTLPLRNFPKKSKRFIDFLSEVKTNTLKAFENQDYPANELEEQLKNHNPISNNPLFNVLFVSENFIETSIKVNDLKFKNLSYEHNIAHMNLVMYFIHRKETIQLILEYSIALFSPATANRMLDHYIEILEQVIKNKNIILSEIDLYHDFLLFPSNSLEEEDTDFNF